MFIKLFFLLLYLIPSVPIDATFLEFRFNISALESTSDDLISELKKIKIMEEWMLNFIQESDLVKFAKYIPNKNEELLFIKHIEDFIKKNIEEGKDNLNNN